MASPFPDLAVHPTSGLSFPWADWHAGDGMHGSGDMSLGPDGVALGMTILIRWQDLVKACKEILGFSWRDTSSTTAAGYYWLRRVLPWQHPYFNQMWAERIAKVQGIRPMGNSVDEASDDFLPAAGGAGPDFTPNFGPWSEFEFASMTIAFSRPPYFIRTDAGVLNGDGNPQEWLRFVDRTWSVTSQVLAQENNAYEFTSFTGSPIAANSTFVGSAGRVITHSKVSRRWYQVPEACLFEIGSDGTPSGKPAHMQFMQTTTTNPITGYVIPATNDSTDVAWRQYPITGTVNSPIGGGIDDSDPDARFFNEYMGTLRFESVELVPRPLQLPAYLMRIPIFADNTAISQQQYDVVFHFDLFDPPRSPTVASNDAALASGAIINQAFRGHNLMPYSGDCMWYPAQSQNPVSGSAYKATAFNYADFSDLFQVLTEIL